MSYDSICFYLLRHNVLFCVKREEILTNNYLTEKTISL